MHDRRLLTFLVLAALLHGSVAVMVGRGRPVPVGEGALVPREGETQEISLDSDPTAAPLAPPPSDPAAIGAAAVSAAGGRSAGSTGAGAAGMAGLASETPSSGEGSPVAEGSSGSEEVGPGVAGSGAGGWTFNPVAQPDLGFGTAKTMGVAARSVHLPEAKPTYGIPEAGDARDRELGLTRTGPLLTATEEAVREGAGPLEGKATFLVSIDRSGNVVATLEDADKDAEAWRRLTEAIARKAHGKPVRMPPNARGLLTRIEIRADLVWPDGQRKQDTDRPSGFYATPPALGDAGVQLPDVGFQANGKLCSARLSLGSLSLAGGCSFENAGAPALRVVHGRITDERRL